MNNTYSDLDKKSLLRIANQFHAELLLSGFSGSDIENILLKKKPDFLCALSAIKLFEISDSKLRESVNDAIYFKLSNSIFSLNTINNYKDFGSELKFNNPVFNIAGSDLPLKIISLSIQDYPAFTQSQSNSLMPLIEYIDSTYIDFHSLSPDYSGLCDHHSNKLGIQIMHPAPLKNHTHKLYEIICNDPSMLEELSSSFNDLNSINRLHEELVEYHDANITQLGFVRLQLIKHIKNTDRSSEQSRGYTDIEVINRIEDLF